MNDTYYILFTCSENNDIKINLMVTSLSNQIENYPFPPEEKNIKIIVCKDNIEPHIKKELLLKETDYSPYYVFLDETDDVPDTYIEEMMLKWNEPKKKCYCNGL